MDLHAWITQQVDETERIARNHQQPSPRWEYDHFVHEIRDLHNAGTVANVYLDGTAAHIEHNDPAAVLRRCEADRRILNRHRIDPGQADSVAYAAACEGCGVDDWGLPNIDNLNDCPELLDLAHAHGLTDDILASLDRPQPGEPCTRMQAAPAQTGIRGLAHALGIKPITTSEVPAALRGPRWKP